MLGAPYQEWRVHFSTISCIGGRKQQQQQIRIRSKHIKGSKERLFIMTQTHSLQTFGVIPFVKLQKKKKKNEQRKENSNNCLND